MGSDTSLPPQNRDAGGVGRPAAPRWVKVFGVVMVVLVLVLLVLHLTGNGIGSGMHGASPTHPAAVGLDAVLP